MSLWQLSAAGPRDALQQISDHLDAHLTFEPSASSLFEIEGRADFTLDVIFQAKPDLAVLKSYIADQNAELAAIDLTLSSIAETGWVEKSLEGLSPIHAGRFFVHGKHDADKVPVGTIPLLIEAGLAFGTGHHGTTEGCLTALSHIAMNERPERVLDLGTGTGILGIAAAKLWHVPVWGSDIDQISVHVAQENARANGAAPHFCALTATGLNHAALRAAAPFDLIVANILAGPLRRMATDIVAALAPGGILVLSGILDVQAKRVDATYRGHHIHSQMRLTFGEWVTLVGRKARTAPASTILD